MVIMLEPVPTALENAYGFLKNLLYRHLLRIFFTDKRPHEMILNVLGEKSSRTGQSIEELLAVLDRRSHEKTESFTSFLASLSHIYVVINKVRSKEQQESSTAFRVSSNAI